MLKSKRKLIAMLYPTKPETPRLTPQGNNKATSKSKIKNKIATI